LYGNSAEKSCICISPWYFRRIRLDTLEISKTLEHQEDDEAKSASNFFPLFAGLSRSAVPTGVKQPLIPKMMVKILTINERVAEYVIDRIKSYNQNKKNLHRKQRGALQWKSARTMKAVTDEMKVGILKAQMRVAITEREPDVEVLFARDESADHVDGSMKGKLSIGHCAIMLSG
jgi:hypothetical protein